METFGNKELIRATPVWFSELPSDIQSIKLAEGSAWVSIVENQSALVPWGVPRLFSVCWLASLLLRRYCEILRMVAAHLLLIDYGLSGR